jgi:hypothetical protein
MNKIASFPHCPLPLPIDKSEHLFYVYYASKESPVDPCRLFTSTLKTENSYRFTSSPISDFEMEASRRIPMFFREK